LFEDRTGVYATEWYNNAASIAGAADLTVDGDVAGINASLELAGAVQPKIGGFTQVAPGSFQMNFVGVVGRRYQLEESADLKKWDPVGASFICAEGGNVLEAASVKPTMFWRVGLVP
jgi:hypothetical protein